MKTPGQLSFRQQIASAYQLLRSVTEEKAEWAWRPGGWSRKEILGHLIDSALNNHQRFVRGALEGNYQGPSYQQEEWVKIHGYKTMAWIVLLEHWRLQNELLCEVVERIPANQSNNLCRVSDSEPVTLRFLVDDYLDHMGHHLQQITG